MSTAHRTGPGDGGWPPPRPAAEHAPTDAARAPAARDDGTPEQATPAQATSVEAAPVENASTEAASPETTPTEGTSTEAASTEAASTEAAPTEATRAAAARAAASAADTPLVESPPAERRRRRDPLAAVLIGVLTLLLGFAFAVQVRSTGTDGQPAGAREEDLVRILDDLTAQEDRLRQEIADQRAALDQLSNSDSTSAAALQEARERAAALGILNGTVAAQGPGITMTIRDSEGRVSSSVLLNAIQELRGAGAETMQVDDVRIGVSSAVTGDPGDLAIDGQDLQAPYTFVVIGSPQDMATAMSIPGGVVSQAGRYGGSVDIVQSEQVVVDALRPLDQPQYADPDDGD